MSDLLELRHEAQRALLRMGIYKFNPNHDEIGRFASGPHQGGRKDLRVQEHGGGAGNETERLQRALEGRRGVGAEDSKNVHAQFTPERLNAFWQGQEAPDIHVHHSALEVDEVMGAWVEMESCKQMRRAAAQIVGVGPVEHHGLPAHAPVQDPFLLDRSKWGGTEGMQKPGESAFQLLHQLHANGGELPVHDVLYRASGIEPATLKAGLKTGEQFDLPLASFGGAHPWLGDKYGDKVIFRLNHPKAALRGTPFSPAYEVGDPISEGITVTDPRTGRSRPARVGDLIPDQEDYVYDKMDGWDQQENDQGEFITGGRFKVKAMKTGSIKGVTQPGKKALIVDLEHIGVFNPWNGKVEG